MGRSSNQARREAAYRRAADTHRRAEASELRAAAFFEAHGDAEASARHRENAARERRRAEADDARAAAAAAEDV